MRSAFDFHPEARAEFAADVDWYDDREDGLGGRFAQAVRAAIDAAVEDPEAWARWQGWDREPSVHAKGVAGFPYRVVYVVNQDVLTIVAVAHAKRRPGYWRDRVRR
ncbi:type II toxin-antitoxin system RelE/ParE family toxin [Nocardioides panzhihuensis]|uniref:Putative cobalt transporter CbtA n=1 Tax=Nocardioides panzhihuensis TaxID=860243 RepID=A0A7Z0DRD4_9ACTN|nr:type II toxin-antitoxin system RelE/ParE family toxin [Nocardioides panzhihuensis]NYI80098.1 putative cobalt transporter CbtA [Nocardioides panzhihuensis]